MKDIITYKLLYKLLVLAGLSLCLWAVSARTKSQQDDRFLTVVVTDQLPARDGVIPVYFVCGQARLSSPNRIEEFQCTFKNNTNLNITAANVTYSIVFDENGVTTRDTFNHTIEALVHPDFRATSKLIEPGGETSVGPPGPTTYSNGAVIKGVETSIDYVQFENGTSLGPDNAGSRIIKAMRSGAQKYKTWLKAKYNLHAKSVAALSSDIEASDGVPKELQADGNEQTGAMEYRRRFQKLLQTTSAADIKKLLDSNQ